MNYLVIGGNGFIVSKLIKYLNDKKNNIFILDKQSFINENNGSAINIFFYKKNFNKKNINKILKQNKIHCVIYLLNTLLPSSNINELKKQFNSQFDNFIFMVEAMNKYSVDKLVFFSSGGTIYGDNKIEFNNENSVTNPINFYGWSKLKIEKFIIVCHHLYNLNYLIIRPSNVYGPGQDLNKNQGFIPVSLGKILDKKPIEIWGDGSVVRDYIYIDDLCNATMSLIKKNCWNNVYNVGSGTGNSLNEIVSQLKKYFNQKITVKYKKKRNVDIAINILNINKINKDINWSPEVDLGEGINRTFNWLINK